MLVRKRVNRDSYKVVHRPDVPKIQTRISLPHPIVTEFASILKTNASWERTCGLDGLGICHWLCDPWPDEADLAMYDEDGNIYLPERFASGRPERAELVALHEQVEISHKLAGRSHAYAHRRAILIELLAAKAMLRGPGQLREHLGWRIGVYPDWKVPDKAAVVAQLYELLAASRPLRGRILDVVMKARL